MIVDKTEFTERFVNGSVGFTPEELATHLKVSKPTLTRWATGKSAPQPIGRESAIDLLEQMRKEM